jgi:hypothetical protein
MSKMNQTGYYGFGVLTGPFEPVFSFENVEDWDRCYEAVDRYYATLGLPVPVLNWEPKPEKSCKSPDLAHLRLRLTTLAVTTIGMKRGHGDSSSSELEKELAEPVQKASKVYEGSSGMQ